MKLDQLSEVQRRTLVLIKAYEDCRRAGGQYGYRSFKTPPEENLNHPVFKQFKTVVEWLASHGWDVGWQSHSWHGYVKFVFEKNAPTAPHPGQLKNPVLLKQYVQSGSQSTAEPVRTEEQMQAIYRRALRPEIIQDQDLSKACNPLYANSQRT